MTTMKEKPKQKFISYEAKPTDNYYRVVYQTKGNVGFHNVHAESKEQAKERSGRNISSIIRVEEI